MLPSFMLQPNSLDSTTPICDLPSPPLPLMTIMRCPLLLGIRQYPMNSCTVGMSSG